MASEADNLEQELKDAERQLNEVKTEEKQETTEASEEKTEKKGTPAKEETEQTEETKEVVDAKEEPVEEELPHSEKSRLGRKVKRLESTLNEINENLKFLRERNTAQVEEIPEPVLPEDPTDTEGLRTYLADRDKWLLARIKKDQTQESQKREEVAQKYSKEYARMLDEYIDSEDDPELYTLLTNEKDLQFNRVHKGDAKEDFLINFRNATDFIRKKATPKKLVLKGKPAPSGINVPDTTIVSKRLPNLTGLSKDEQDLAKLFSADELKELGIG